MGNNKRPFRKYSFLFSAVILMIILISYSFCKRENKDQILMQLVTNTLSVAHFSPLNIDDSFSEKVYGLFLKRMDYNKHFFTKGDIKRLDYYKTRIDDEVKSGNLDFYNTVDSMFLNRLDRVQKYYAEILARPFNFNKEESFQTDPTKLDYPKDDAALKDRWRKTLKYQELLRLTDMIESQQKDKSDTAKRKTFAQMEQEARARVLKQTNELFNYYRQTTESDRFSVFINSIASVYDPHTQYLSPKQQEDFNVDMTGQLEGIGAQLQETNGNIKVVEIVPGSASWLEGELKVNDIILKVAQENGKPVDIQDMRIDDVVKLIRGKKGTKVTLTVKQVNGAIKNITITRDVVILKDTYAKSAIVDSPDGKVGYIYLPKFYADFNQTATGRSCAEDVEKEVNKLKRDKVTGIIMDLRNNGGGSLGDAIRMAGLFVGKGPIVQVKYKNRPATVLENTDPLVHFKGPMVVMVNSLSASASEIFSAAMQDYHRAIIMGSPTFGKGTVQTEINLDNRVAGPYEGLAPFGSLLVTIQKFYRINGGATQLKGVTPDVILPDPYSELGTGERSEEFCMPWNKIAPASYTTWTGMPNFEPVVKDEEHRIAEDSDFRIIKAQALEVKREKDETDISLNVDKYMKLDKELKAKSKSFETITRKPTGMNVFALPQDLEAMKGDTVSLSTRKKWITGLSKDLYLREAVHTIDLLETVKK